MHSNVKDNGVLPVSHFTQGSFSSLYQNSAMALMQTERASSMLGRIKDSKVEIAFHSCFDLAKQLLITNAAVKQLLPCHQAIARQARKLLGL